MNKDYLKNLIVSDILYTLGKGHFKMSPKLDDTPDSQKTHRIREAEIEFAQFTKINVKKRKKRTSK